MKRLPARPNSGLRRKAALIAAVLALIVLAAGCAPPSSPPPPSPQTPATTQPQATPTPEPGAIDPPPPPPVDRREASLLLYDTPGFTKLLQKAIEVYKRQYPDVAVEFRTFGDLTDIGVLGPYYETMATEAAVGLGPDVSLRHALEFWPHPLDAGNYADLDAHLADDLDFNAALYQEGAITAGYHRGQRLGFPLAFRSNVWLTTQEVLDDADISLQAGGQSVQQLFWQMEAYRAAQDKPVLAAQIMGENLTSLIPWCGLRLADYDAQTLMPDSPELRQIIDGYKNLFFYDSVMREINRNSYGGLLEDGQCLFIKPASLTTLVMTYAALKTNSTPVLVSAPSFDGRSVGVPTSFVLLKKDGENQREAYNFLKVLLSEELQTSGLVADLPVLRSAFPLILKKTIETSCMPGRIVNSDGYTMTFAELTEDDLTAITDTVYEVYACALDLMPHLLSMAMVDYFEGARSYEDCLADFQNQMANELFFQLP